MKYKIIKSIFFLICIFIQSSYSNECSQAYSYEKIIINGNLLIPFLYFSQNSTIEIKTDPLTNIIIKEINIAGNIIDPEYIHFSYNHYENLKVKLDKNESYIYMYRTNLYISEEKFWCLLVINEEVLNDPINVTNKLLFKLYKIPKTSDPLKIKYCIYLGEKKFSPVFSIKIK